MKTIIPTMPSAEEQCIALDIAFKPEQYARLGATGGDLVPAEVHHTLVKVLLVNIESDNGWSLTATATFRRRTFKLSGWRYAEGVMWLALPTRDFPDE